jgi:glucose-1-phosphate thymidylyltransferase
MKATNNLEEELVGVIPAAGIATRMAPLPCSKELLPIGYYAKHAGDNLRPKPVCLYLLQAMRSAGVRRAFMVLRTGKWDIPAYLGSGALVGMNIGYLVMQHPYGAPFTIDESYPFVQNVNIAFGFPDILYHEEGVYEKLYQHLLNQASDVVLGGFRTRPGQRADMVDIDQQGNVFRILIKPEKTDLTYAWITAVWRPSFTSFLHHYVHGKLQNIERETMPETYIGEVLQAAIESGMKVQAVCFPNAEFIDIGTPEGYLEANQSFRSS